MITPKRQAGQVSSSRKRARKDEEAGDDICSPMSISSSNPTTLRVSERGVPISSPDGGPSADCGSQWVTVTEETHEIDRGSNALSWLLKAVVGGELRTAAFKDNSWNSERTQPAPMRFGPMPALDTDSRGSRLDRWIQQLYRAPGKGEFQRVRVALAETGLQEFSDAASASDSAADASANGIVARASSMLLAALAPRPVLTQVPVNVVAEWNPSLALEQMATKLRFHSDRLHLAWRVRRMEDVAAAAKEKGQVGQAIAEIVEEEEGQFQIKGCQDEACARQPPRFREHPLRPEQLRSLHWMLQREAKSVNFETEHVQHIIPGLRWEDQPENRCDWRLLLQENYWQAFAERSGFSWCYEATLRSSFVVPGGVLGDAIGSGKTATLIGLLDSQRGKPAMPLPAEAQHLIPTKATLILVPANLVRQWDAEFKKFLGPDAFKFLVITSIADMRQLTAKQLADCEVVLCTYKLFYSTDYVERLKSLSCTRANCLHERSFLGKNLSYTLAEVERAQEAFMTGSRPSAVGWTMRVRTNKEREAVREAETDHTLPLSSEEVERRINLLGLCKEWKELTQPVFELFYWHRIVFDEFHELEAMAGRQFTMLENLRSRFRWGLTGTPPTRDNAQIKELARLLRVSISENDRIDCQRFLDAFVRKNKAELPEIPVEEHMIRVQQTAEERALYLQQEFDGDRRKLLQFCSHHCWGKDSAENGGQASSVDSAMSARTTALRLGEKKRAEEQAQQQLVIAEYTVLAALESGLRRHKDGKAEVNTSNALAERQAAARAMSCPELDRVLGNLPSASSGADEDGHNKLVRAAINAVDPTRPGGGSCQEVLKSLLRTVKPTLSQLRGAHLSQQNRCVTVLGKLLGTVRSRRFFEAMMKALQGNEGERGDCPVCLEPLTPQTMAMLPCAHAFHLKCIHQIHSAQGAAAMCPTCREPFRQGDAAMVSAPPASARNKASRVDVERFGSKLAILGQTLRQILSKEPQAKAIVFVQWKELEELVGEALTKMNIDHIRLRGATKQRSRLIADFQELPEPSVLLQSLENSASGANLTRASHVLLVHPMDADSVERAVAYEMQALGRVRRCGQEAKKVHLWRFVTDGTIEEEISRIHGKGVADGFTATSGQRSSGSASNWGSSSH